MKIAFSIGDPAGIGINLLLLHAQKNTPYDRVVFSHPDILIEKSKQLGLPIKFAPYDPNKKKQQAGEITLIPLKENATLTISLKNACHTLASIKTATQYCLNNHCDRLVTLPVHKGLINQAGHTFTGHTEFLATLTNTPNTVMLLKGEKFNIACATTHIPLKNVATQLNPTMLRQTITIIHNELQQKFNIPQPNIAILGINPHCGDEGSIGNEENTLLKPLINDLNQNNYHLEGPYSADSYFINPSQHNCILAMYHDQALIPFKQAHQFSGTNITLGLPIIRGSVDHGTAFEKSNSLDISTQSLDYTLQTLINIPKL